MNEINQEDEIIDKENVDPSMLKLQNPKKRIGKGRPLGTKRFKSSTEALKPKSRNQRHCRKCGKVGHYQKNCKVFIDVSFLHALLFLTLKFITTIRNKKFNVRE